MADGSVGPRGALLILSAMLVIAGAWLAYAEARPYVTGGVVDAERVAALETGPIAYGPSIGSQRAVLEGCVRALLAAGARGQPAGRLRAVGNNCMTIADGITSASPSDAYAWYVGALSAYRTDDAARAIDRLLRSQQAGPNEQWIAELRVGLGEALLDRLPDNARIGHDRDLGMLVASERGIASIADRYVRVPDFRERITAIVEKLPAEHQRRFIGTIRNATDQAMAL